LRIIYTPRNTQMIHESEQTGKFAISRQER